MLINFRLFFWVFKKKRYQKIRRLKRKRKKAFSTVNADAVEEFQSCIGITFVDDIQIANKVQEIHRQTALSGVWTAERSCNKRRYFLTVRLLRRATRHELSQTTQIKHDENNTDFLGKFSKLTSYIFELMLSLLRTVHAQSFLLSSINCVLLIVSVLFSPSIMPIFATCFEFIKK